MTRPAGALDAVALPHRIRELYRILGAEALLALAREYGGQRLYVPKQIRPQHAIADVAGLDAARALAGHYGGESIEVPLMTSYRSALRASAILAERGRTSARDAARRYGTTERHVYRIWSGDTPHAGQLDMFSPDD